MNVKNTTQTLIKFNLLGAVKGEEVDRLLVEAITKLKKSNIDEIITFSPQCCYDALGDSKPNRKSSALTRPSCRVLFLPECLFA